MSWQSCLIQATAVVLILLCAITSGKVNIVEREHNLDNRLINDRCILLLYIEYRFQSVQACSYNYSIAYIAYSAVKTNY